MLVTDSSERSFSEQRQDVAPQLASGTTAVIVGEGVVRVAGSRIVRSRFRGWRWEDMSCAAVC